MLKAILIDIDDTLLSFQGFVKESMKEGFPKFGLGEYEDEMYSVFTRINKDLWHRLEEGTLSFEELKKVRWNMIFEVLGFQADGIAFEAYFRDFLFDNAILEDGALELMEYLKGKYILCAASNGPYDQQVNRLKKGGLLPYFSHLFISEEIGHAKPSGEFFKACLYRLNKFDTVLPEEMMILGDSVSSDMVGGINFGIKTLYYNPKDAVLPPEIKPDFTVRSLREIQSIL